MTHENRKMRPFMECGFCKAHPHARLCRVCDHNQSAIEELEAEVKRLRAALQPFANMGIPSNWPGQCRLRIDNRLDGSEFLSYHGEPEAWMGVLPTLAEWREAAKAAGGK